MDHSGMDHGAMGNMGVTESTTAPPHHDMGSGMMGKDVTTGSPHDMNMGGGAGVGSHGGEGGHTSPALHGAFFSFNLPVFILFQEWHITTQGELAGACAGTFLLAVLYEGLKVLREIICRNKQITPSGKSKLRSFCSGWHFLQSIFQVIQTTIGMFLMLIFMTFHGWLAISVSLGSGVGHLIFGWLRTSIRVIDDHCN